VDYPLPEGRGYRKCAPALAGSQVKISLKGRFQTIKEILMKVVIIGYFTEYSEKRIAQEFPSDWKLDIVAP
jgi:hypothetical protein